MGFKTTCDLSICDVISWDATCYFHHRWKPFYLILIERLTQHEYLPRTLQRCTLSEHYSHLLVSQKSIEIVNLLKKEAQQWSWTRAPLLPVRQIDASKQRRAIKNTCWACGNEIRTNSPMMEIKLAHKNKYPSSRTYTSTPTFLISI